MTPMYCRSHLLSYLSIKGYIHVNDIEIVWYTCCRSILEWSLSPHRYSPLLGFLCITVPICFLISSIKGFIHVNDIEIVLYTCCRSTLEWSLSANGYFPLLRFLCITVPICSLISSIKGSTDLCQHSSAWTTLQPWEFLLNANPSFGQSGQYSPRLVYIFQIWPICSKICSI